ncbi:hypothetical protein [Moraxella lacunata]|uniref:hypothetical protein n=1 Tax=Moraxella lacunata TaxID=477 RepID=UPI003EDEE33E
MSIQTPFITAYLSLFILWGVPTFCICNEKCLFKKAGESPVFQGKNLRLIVVLSDKFLL